MDHKVKEQEVNIVVSFAQLKKVIIRVFVNFFTIYTRIWEMCFSLPNHTIKSG